MRETGYGEPPSPPYHELYRVEHRITTYLRLARSTDGCNPIMSHGSANVFQAEDGGMPLQNPSCPAISCRAADKIVELPMPEAQHEFVAPGQPDPESTLCKSTIELPMPEVQSDATGGAP